MKVKLNDLYPGKYFKAADVAEKPVGVTINGVRLEALGDDPRQKPILRFSDARQEMVLNKTNGYRLAELFGDNTDAWIGKRIVLVPSKAQFGSKMVDSVRILSPAEYEAQAKARKAEPALNDAMPF